LPAGTYRLLVTQVGKGVSYLEPRTVELAVSRDGVVIEVPGNVRVHGRVINAATGQPVAEADLFFEPAAAAAMGYGEAGRSDAEGAWSVNTPPGKHKVTARKAGYTPGVATVDAASSQDPAEVRIALSPAPEPG
jgi:hypothetical protein